VLCADSYFFSNEALWAERHPQLLVWLMGAMTNIVFDEAHFGINKQPGVAGLIRRYRFQWFFAALALLAILFVWKNAVYFVPPSQDSADADGQVNSEKDANQGLVALLRRNIAVNEILAVCVREWTRSVQGNRRIRPAIVANVKKMIAMEIRSSKKPTDPVAGYQKICRIVSEDRGND
jgi:hypothetical protein